MNPVLSTQLGTRHRAGIGITEETDAVAVIVSEESGAISIAAAGKIERDITPDQLRIRLGELLHRTLPPMPAPIVAGETLLEDEARDVLPADIDSSPADVPEENGSAPRRSMAKREDRSFDQER
jgi:hypothetical protein